MQIPIFTVFCVVSVSADDFPSYFEKCKTDDPDLFNCIVNSGNKVIPNIVKGIPTFGIPILDPFEITEISIVPTRTLSATFRDVKISGLRKAKLKNVTTDLVHGRDTFTVFVEKLEISVEYDIHGQILVLPIYGKGHGNMTLVNATFNTFEVWDVICNDKDNEEYFDLKHFNLTYDMDRVYTHLENLFDGNKILGLPKYGIPTLDPFKISKIDILPSSSLRATFRNVEISGLRKSRFIDIGADFEKRTGYFSIFVDRLDINTEYDVHAQILVLPISGQGHGNMTIYNATFKAATYWEMQHNEKDDEDYFNLLTFKVTYDMDRVYTHLDNLFNGNKELGDNMNRFLNDNWKEFAKDVEPAVGDTIGTVLKSFVDNLTLKVPFKHWFAH